MIPQCAKIYQLFVIYGKKNTNKLNTNRFSMICKYNGCWLQKIRAYYFSESIVESKTFCFGIMYFSTILLAIFEYPCEALYTAYWLPICNSTPSIPSENKVFSLVLGNIAPCQKAWPSPKRMRHFYYKWHLISSRGVSSPDDVAPRTLVYTPARGVRTIESGHIWFFTHNININNKTALIHNPNPSYLDTGSLRSLLPF